MTQPDFDLLGYCSLYCGDCLRHHGRVPALAAELGRALDAADFSSYARVKAATEPIFGPYDRIRESIEALAALNCTRSCRQGGGCSAFDCRFVACCRARGLLGCWECDRFEDCAEFDFLKPFHGDRFVTELRRINAVGLDNWLRDRPRFYAWPQP